MEIHSSALLIKEQFEITTNNITEYDNTYYGIQVGLRIPTKMLLKVVN